MASLRQKDQSSLFYLASSLAIPFGEASKRVADVWKSLPEEQKQVYVELSRQEQEATQSAVGVEAS